MHSILDNLSAGEASVDCVLANGDPWLLRLSAQVSESVVRGPFEEAPAFG
jgi:hypothetical protein